MLDECPQRGEDVVRGDGLVHGGGVEDQSLSDHVELVALAQACLAGKQGYRYKAHKSRGYRIALAHACLLASADPASANYAPTSANPPATATTLARTTAAACTSALGRLALGACRAPHRREREGQTV